VQRLKEAMEGFENSFHLRVGVLPNFKNIEKFNGLKEINVKPNFSQAVM